MLIYVLESTTRERVNVSDKMAAAHMVARLGFILIAQIYAQ
jgi:hypothetical protein